MEQYDLPTNDSTDHSRNIRYVMYFGVVLILVFLVYFSVNKAKTQSVQVEDSDLNSNNAYFIPPAGNSSSRTLSGTIIHSAYITHEGIDISHKFLNENSDTVAFLYSDTNNLDLSVGFDVVVVGISEKNSYNDIEVVHVESIKLK